MCITTTIPPPQPTPAPKLDRISATCTNEACKSIATKQRTKRVTFQDEPQIFDTLSIADLSKEEIESMWITDSDWDEMRRDFFLAKRKKCPTVEMSQPYRVSDRTATIRYCRMVVKREETKFLKAVQQWQEQSAKSSTTETKPPCWNCYSGRIAKLYALATRKSLDEAFHSGRRYELQVKAQEVVMPSKTTATTPAKLVVCPTNNKRKMVPAITVPAC